MAPCYTGFLADFDVEPSSQHLSNKEAVWCNVVTGNSTLTVGLVYRSPNISMEENEKIHNAIKEVSKRDCIIMGDFNHGHIHGHLYRVPGERIKSFLI